MGPTVKRLRRLSKKWRKLVGTFDPAQITLPVATPRDMLGSHDNWPPVLIEDEKELKDPSVPNDSRIALLLEYLEKALFLTDDGRSVP